MTNEQALEFLWKRLAHERDWADELAVTFAELPINDIQGRADTRTQLYRSIRAVENLQQLIERMS